MIKIQPTINGKRNKDSAKSDIDKNHDKDLQIFGTTERNATGRYNNSDIVMGMTVKIEWKSTVVNGDTTKSLHEDYY